MKKAKTADSAEAPHLVKQLQYHITQNYSNCTNQIPVGPGKMYVAVERFKNNIDKHADSTAQFICNAIEVHCRK